MTLVIQLDLTVEDHEPTQKGTLRQTPAALQLAAVAGLFAGKLKEK